MARRIGLCVHVLAFGIRHSAVGACVCGAEAQNWLGVCFCFDWLRFANGGNVQTQYTHGIESICFSRKCDARHHVKMRCRSTARSSTANRLLKSQKFVNNFKFKIRGSVCGKTLGNSRSKGGKWCGKHFTFQQSLLNACFSFPFFCKPNSIRVLINRHFVYPQFQKHFNWQAEIRQALSLSLTLCAFEMDVCIFSTILCSFFLVQKEINQWFGW